MMSSIFDGAFGMGTGLHEVDKWSLHVAMAQICLETEQRLVRLGRDVRDVSTGWMGAVNEASYYSTRERAALEWTEGVTRIAETHVPDSIYSDVREQLSEKDHRGSSNDTRVHRPKRERRS
jgi:hypothetical protein